MSEEIDKAAQAVVNAWVDSGINPAYHRIQQARLRDDWPVMFKAIYALVKATMESHEETT